MMSETRVNTEENDTKGQVGDNLQIELSGFADGLK